MDASLPGVSGCDRESRASGGQPPGGARGGGRGGRGFGRGGAVAPNRVKGGAERAMDEFDPAELSE